MLKVDLAGVPAQVARIVFPVSIYDAQTRGQNFGQVRNAFIRIVNQDGGAEIAAMTWPRTPAAKPRWCSASSTATAQTGSSGLSGRARPPGCAASPSTTASTSEQGSPPGNTAKRQALPWSVKQQTRVQTAERRATHSVACRRSEQTVPSAGVLSSRPAPVGGSVASSSMPPG